MSQGWLCLMICYLKPYFVRIILFTVRNFWKIVLSLSFLYLQTYSSSYCCLPAEAPPTIPPPSLGTLPLGGSHPLPLSAFLPSPFSFLCVTWQPTEHPIPWPYSHHTCLGPTVGNRDERMEHWSNKYKTRYHQETSQTSQFQIPRSQGKNTNMNSLLQKLATLLQ